MTQRKHLTCTSRVIARVIEHESGRGARRGNLVLLPKLPIRWQEIGNLIGSPIQSFVSRNVAATDSIPAIRGDFNRAPHPVLLLQAGLVSNRDIFGTPHNLVITSQVWPELADLEEPDLIAELH